MTLPAGAMEDSEHSGWYSWGEFPRGSFAAQTGKLLFRPDGERQARTRMFPTEMHLNLGGSIHGGAVMSFIDMSLFAGGHCAGMVPLDAVVRLVGQTRGGHVFLSGHCEQEGQPTHSFTGTLKRVTRPNAPAQDDDRPRR